MINIYRKVDVGKEKNPVRTYICMYVCTYINSIPTCMYFTARSLAGI